MSTLNTDFQSQYDAMIIEILQRYKYSIPNGTDSDSLRLQYFGFLRRIVSPHPRNIHMSFSMDDHPEHRSAVEEIIDSIEKGGNFTTD